MRSIWFSFLWLCVGVLWASLLYWAHEDRVVGWAAGVCSTGSVAESARFLWEAIRGK